jgi:hypothetical protein
MYRHITVNPGYLLRFQVMAPGTPPADFPGRDSLFFGQMLLELWPIPAADSFLVITALVLPDSNPSKEEECKTNDR